MIFNYLNNRPNNIIEKQKLYQSGHLPIYYRGPRGRYYMYAYYTAFTITMVATANGLYTLVKGKK